jgi:hypothetical protein
MSIKCPILSKTLVFADDPLLAAQASCVLVQEGTYLPIIDGPRLTGPDRHAEVIRRNNAAARANPDRIILTGISDEAYEAMMRGFTLRLRSRVRRIRHPAEMKILFDNKSPLRHPSLVWGQDRIGVGLLNALRARSGIEFLDQPSPIEQVTPMSDHLVVCEDGDELAPITLLPSMQTSTLFQQSTNLPPKISLNAYIVSRTKITCRLRTRWKN